MLFGSLASIFLSLLAFVFSLLKIKFNITMIGAIACAFIFMSLFFISKKKYEELEQQYKEEKHSKLKGWLVFLYLIGSVVLYFVSISVFDV